MIIHGLELARKTPPYFPPDDSFTARDAGAIERWGFDAVRLAWFWKGLEPGRGVFDRSYLAQIERDGDLLAAHHIFTLLEAHQDGYNETLGGAGFPDWATLTDGTWAPFASAPGAGIFDLQAARAFDNLYANTDGIADEFARAWATIATGFADNPMMLGYDLFNEPNPGSEWESCVNPVGCPAFDAASLQPLENKLAAAVRGADPRTIAFYEPNIYFDSGVPSWLTRPPMASGPSGFAFHDYCLSALLTGRPDQESASPGYPSCPLIDRYVFNNAIRAAAAMGVPPLFDEFGDTQDPAQIERVIKTADQNLTGWVYWSYKDWVDDPGGQGSGPLFDDSDDDGTLRTAKLMLLSQPYPVATAGIPLLDRFDPSSGTFNYKYLPNRRISAPTVIFTAPLHYPHGYVAKVEGATVVAVGNPSYLEVRATGHRPIVSVQLTPVAGSPSPGPPSAGVGPFRAAPAAAAPAPFASTSGSCAGTPDRPAIVESPAVAAGARDVVAEVHMSGAAGELTNRGGDSVAFGNGDTDWLELGPVDAGAAARVAMICRSGRATYAVSFDAVPQLPATFSGSSTHDVNVSLAGSRVAFDVPVAGDYVAEVSLTEGPLELGPRVGDDSSYPARILTTSGSVDLGRLPAGIASLDVTPLGSAQAAWSVTIQAG